MLPSDRPIDVLENIEARALLLDLDARGVRLLVLRGNLATRTPERLTDADRAALRRHKADLLVLVLVTHDECLDRLLAMHAGRVGSSGSYVTGCCYLCAELLPADRPHGRCGWCGLASRLFAGCLLTSNLLALFDDDLRGLQAGSMAGGGLPFDTAVPA